MIHKRKDNQKIQSQAALTSEIEKQKDQAVCIFLLCAVPHGHYPQRQSFTECVSHSDISPDLSSTFSFSFYWSDLHRMHMPIATLAKENGNPKTSSDQSELTAEVEENCTSDEIQLCNQEEKRNVSQVPNSECLFCFFHLFSQGSISQTSSHESAVSRECV